MSARGWDDPALEPPLREVDADLAYELVRQRIDDGLECPTCHRTSVRQTVSLGLRLFVCQWCSTEWFDHLTRPTCE